MFVFIELVYDLSSLQQHASTVYWSLTGRSIWWALNRSSTLFDTCIRTFTAWTVWSNNEGKRWFHVGRAHHQTHKVSCSSQVQTSGRRKKCHNWRNEDWWGGVACGRNPQNEKKRAFAHKVDISSAHTRKAQFCLEFVIQWGLQEQCMVECRKCSKRKAQEQSPAT